MINRIPDINDAKAHNEYCNNVKKLMTVHIKLNRQIQAQRTSESKSRGGASDGDGTSEEWDVDGETKGGATTSKEGGKQAQEQRQHIEEAIIGGVFADAYVDHGTHAESCWPQELNSAITRSWHANTNQTL